MEKLHAFLRVVTPTLLLLSSFPALPTGQIIDENSCMGDKQTQLSSAITEALTFANIAAMELLSKNPKNSNKNERAVQALFGGPLKEQLYIPTAMEKYVRYAKNPTGKRAPIFICGDSYLSRETNPETGKTTVNDHFGIAAGSPAIVLGTFDDIGPTCNDGHQREAEAFTYMRMKQDKIIMGDDMDTIIIVCQAAFTDTILTIGEKLRLSEMEDLIAEGGPSINFWRRKYVSMIILHELAHALLWAKDFKVGDQKLKTTVSVPGDTLSEAYLYDGATALVNQGDQDKASQNADSYTMLLMITMFEKTDYSNGILT